MKSGGPWNLRSRRPRTHEPARDTGQRPSTSLGEWLNAVIERSDSEDDPYAPPRPSQRREGGPYHDSHRGERHERSREGRRHREADYGARPERQDQDKPYRSAGRVPQARDERHARRFEGGGPYRDNGRDERYARQSEATFHRDTEDAQYAEPHKSRHDNNRDRNPEHEEWYERLPVCERGSERDRQQEQQRKAKRAPVAEPDRPERQPERNAGRDAEAGEPQQRRAAEDARDREGAGRERLSQAREQTPRRNEFDEVNARLDKLAQQLEHLARVAAAPSQVPPVEAQSEPIDPPLSGAPAPIRKVPSEPRHPPVDSAAPRVRQVPSEQVAPPLTIAPPPARKASSEPHDLPLTGAPQQRRRASAEPAISIDDAVAEIAARQRVLDQEAPAIDETAVPTEASAPASESVPAVASASGPVLDIDSLEQQLRQITARIEALQPSQEIENAIAALRSDLAEIGRQLNEALPRRALESLESEIKALAARIDFSRQAGVDPTALAGLERGLAEVRDALRGLTPAENLVGADEAVSALAQKVETILARDDPTMVQQLEAAIGGLRGVVAHVASNDTLNKVAEDVRVLAAQVDAIANNAATAHAVASLEQRIDALAAALHASSEAGQAVPRDLEKLLAGLIDKLEWVQLTHTDHAALGHLEDRIAMLVKRFDASEARFAQLESIERGLADLLVHVEQTRGADSAGAPAAWHAPAAAPAFEEQTAEIARSEPSFHESRPTMQDTVEHVADRLAMIESNIYDSAASAAPAPMAANFEPAPAPQHARAEPIVPDEIVSLLAATPAAPAETAAAIAAPAPPAALRPPLDPTLPPDHPLEVGFTSSGSGSGPRPTASAAERVAASEAAIESAKPPVIPDAGRPNFIAAARRAAQAASWEPSTVKSRQQPELAETTGQPSKLSQRLRKLIVAGSALLIVVGCARIAMRLLDDGRTINNPAPVHSQQIPAPVSPTPAPPAQKSAPGNAPAAQAPALQLPDPPGAAAPRPAPVPAPTKPIKPEQQSLQQEEAHESVVKATPPAEQPAANGLPLWATPDITGTLPRGIAGPEKPRAAIPAPAAAANSDDLPATIGDPALLAAALGGDPAAAYEIAARFAEGRGVTKDSTAAARWLERAAKQGLVPAQFRLGGLYEKGIGVKKDLARARDLYLAAAQKGNGKAMHNLAVLYAEGVEGAPDYTSAAEWFRRGAEHGVSDSQYNLGILYGRGIGVSQNYAESYKWFALAANQGDQDAAGKRDEVAGHLDAQALAAARATVQNFKPEPQPDEAINVKTAAAWQSPPSAQAPAKSK